MSPLTPRKCWEITDEFSLSMHPFSPSGGLVVYQPVCLPLSADVRGWGGGGESFLLPAVLLLLQSLPVKSKGWHRAQRSGGWI